MRLALAALVALSWPVAPALAQRAPSPLRDTLQARSVAFFRATGTPGLAVGVWKDGRVIYARGFGVRAAGEPWPVTTRTVFHMASISKTFVATAVMQLVEGGKVDLDLPVTTYVPYFQLKDDRYRAITVRQVLSHTAGLPDVGDYAWDSPEYDDGALERWIRGLRDSTLIAAPGAKWEYSNIGFELLADLVSIVSGETFETYVKRHILVPAGMRHSTFLMTDVDSANLASGHEPTPTGQRRAYPYNRRHAGSSTMHSNVEDLLRYGAAHAGRGTSFLRPATYDLMWAPQRDITSDFTAEDLKRRNLGGVSMGLGWFLPTFAGAPIMTHSGGDRGFRSYLIVDPRHQVVVVVFVNSENDTAPLAYSLLTVATR